MPIAYLVIVLFCDKAREFSSVSFSSLVRFFFKMGSTFSIENDTKEEYYMTYYNCQGALWGSVGAVAVAALIATGAIKPTAVATATTCHDR